MLERFPEKLKWLRKRRGLSQEQLATQLDITDAYICYLEHGKRKPGAGIVLKIADFFGIPVEALLRDELDLDADER
jgi:transcriptional regulator with XRE-family HTH domain